MARAAQDVLFGPKKVCGRPPRVHPTHGAQWHRHVRRLARVEPRRGKNVPRARGRAQAGKQAAFAALCWATGVPGVSIKRHPRGQERGPPLFNAHALAEKTLRDKPAPELPRRVNNGQLARSLLRARGLRLVGTRIRGDHLHPTPFGGTGHGVDVAGHALQKPGRCEERGGKTGCDRSVRNTAVFNIIRDSGTGRAALRSYVISASICAISCEIEIGFCWRKHGCQTRTTKTHCARMSTHGIAVCIQRVRSTKVFCERDRPRKLFGGGGPLDVGAAFRCVGRRLCFSHGQYCTSSINSWIQLRWNTIQPWMNRATFAVCETA